METKYYVLMAFKQEQLVTSWHFKAPNSGKLAKKMLLHLIEIDANFRHLFEATNYSLDKTGTTPYINIFFELLNKADEQKTDEHLTYRLYEMETSHNGSAIVELKTWKKTDAELQRENDRRIERLKEAGDGVIITPLWKKQKDVSLYYASTQEFDLEWVQTWPRLRQIENKYLEEKLVTKLHKGETVCVYFSGINPTYVHRRSTINPSYEWLIRVNEFNLWSYEKKAWMLREHQTRIEQIQLMKTEIFQQNALISEEAKVKAKVLEAEYQAAKARIVDAGREKLEKQKQDWKKFKDDCMHNANVWLYGHTPESLRNNTEWLLAEQEEAELLDWDERLKVND